MQLVDLNTSVAELQNLFEELGWLINEQVIGSESPGEGNMNIVLRIITDTRSFIIKQSRPYVQKFQDIPAPIERIATEFQFYECVKRSGNHRSWPEIFAYSEEHYLMMMQDLGDCSDLMSSYNHGALQDDVICRLVNIAQAIHNTPITKEFPENRALRQLNHQHIFVLPFRKDNGFDLDNIQDGLQELSVRYKSDEVLKKQVLKLGHRYLSSGQTLIHGDYYPGSWMQSKEDLYVLDPEFCFVGDAEFDIGVMAAHLVMATSDTTPLKQVTNYYSSKISLELIYQYCGIEIMRRIIGLAQLPLKRTIIEKQRLLSIARGLVVSFA